MINVQFANTVATYWQHQNGTQLIRMQRITRVCTRLRYKYTTHHNHETATWWIVSLFTTSNLSFGPIS